VTACEQSLISDVALVDMRSPGKTVAPDTCCTLVRVGEPNGEPTTAVGSGASRLLSCSGRDLTDASVTNPRSVAKKAPDPRSVMGRRGFLAKPIQIDSALAGDLSLAFTRATSLPVQCGVFDCRLVSVALLDRTGMHRPSWSVLVSWARRMACFGAHSVIGAGEA
jgi:hypothetical protein